MSEEGRINVNELSADELRTKMEEHGLPTTGSKTVLRERLKGALEDDNLGDDEAVEDALTFKDVEDSIEIFSGDGKQNVQQWIDNFEETAELCGWTDVRKIVYAKRLLRGLAKLFVNFESCARSWLQLRRALLTEFGRTLNSRQVHKELSTARKKSSETYQEYIYRMLESASHADIELKVKIQYIIDGYEALGTSQKYKSKQAEDNSKRHARFKDEADTKRCYNCGDKKHVSNDCPSKEKGTKCFKCGTFGHIAAKGTKEAKEKTSGAAKETKVRCDLTRIDDRKTYKVVNILGNDVNAILNTGSDLHLMRAGQYVALGAPTLDLKQIPFEGVGTGGGVTLGSFIADIRIDDNLFECQIHVLLDNYLAHDLLLEGELSDMAEVRIKRRQATIVKIEDDAEEATTRGTSTTVGWKEVLAVSVELTSINRRTSYRCIISPNRV
ncbi:unnamed protein product [Lasius platythorax]|uniref:Uncharacterized protein n=1 Tax=Lasius platythorax TaxID=488582 RepID=A0AAV2NMC4_9HYME